MKIKILLLTGPQDNRVGILDLSIYLQGVQASYAIIKGKATEPLTWKVEGEWIRASLSSRWCVAEGQLPVVGGQ